MYLVHVLIYILVRFLALVVGFFVVVLIAFYGSKIVDENNSYL